MRCTGRLSARAGWTIREKGADRPRGHSELYEIAARTFNSAPRKTNRPWWTRGPSTLSRTIRHSSTERPQTSWTKNNPTQRIEQKTCKNTRRTRRALKTRKNTQRTWRALGCLAPRALSTLRGQSCPSSTLWRSTPPPLSRSLKSTKGLLPNHRGRWIVSRRFYSY
jgi:hypothetical protein